MSNFNLVVKNTLFQSLGKFATLLLSLTTTTMLARSLGPVGYGDYTFITAFVLLFATVADWGTNIIAVREASARSSHQESIFGNITLIRFLLSLLALILLNIMVSTNPGWSNLSLPLFVGSFVLLALSLKTSFGIVFQALLRYELSATVEIIFSISFLILAWVAVSWQKSLVNIIFAWFLATFISAVAAFLVARRISKFEWKMKWSNVYPILKEAFPAGALFIVFTIYNRVDTIILEHFSGAHAVGVYGLAYKVHDNLVLGAAFLMNALFPILARNFKDATKFSILKNQYQKTFDILLVSSVFIFFFAYLMSGIIIQILGGLQFAESTPLLKVLLFATVIAYFNHLTGYSLIAFGKQKSSLFIATVALLFNVVANIIFVPIYSYKASALITVATEALVLLLSTIVVAKTIKYTPTFFSFPNTLLSFLKTRKIDL